MYGQHLSTDEVNELVTPSQDSLKLVQDWLREHGISAAKLKYSTAKDWISVKVPVKSAEELLDCKYSTYRHKDDGSYVVRTPKWSLPRHLHDHIDTIQPTNSFFRARAQRSTLRPIGDVAHGAISAIQLSKAHIKLDNPTVAAVCNASNVTPDCLRTLYGTIDYTVQSADNNKVGLANYLHETNNRSDVALFLQRFRPDAVAGAQSFKIEIINNGENKQEQLNETEIDDGKDLEGNLDAETILGISYPTPLTAYNTGGEPPFDPSESTPTNTNEPYLEWVNYVLADEDAPYVISTSYGDDEQTVPYSYAKRVCDSFAQLGSKGRTLLFSSGDSGVGPDGACISNDGLNRTKFIPEFPTSCPYVTSVGATKDFNPEVAAFDPRNGFVSGGGFSNYFPRPSFQDKAVGAYIASLGTQFAGLYNTTGRAYPDISAQGQAYAVVWNGGLVHLDGTSASSPAAAAILSLVNDALLASNKPVLGWINPWLYVEGYKAFTDIKSGAATGCNTTGFPSQEGWDPVTGWGTPFFPKVKGAALQIQETTPPPPKYSGY